MCWWDYGFVDGLPHEQLFSWATKECFAHYGLKTDSKIQWMLQYGQVKTCMGIQRLKTNHVISAIGQHDQK